jgi:hypothetical protein
MMRMHWSLEIQASMTIVTQPSRNLGKNWSGAMKRSVYKWLKVATVIAIVICSFVWQSSQAAPTGDSSPNFGSGFTLSGLTLNGGATIDSGRLRLTDGGNSEARSVFFDTPVNIQSFANDFSFQLTSADADGFTFTIQGQGTTVVGDNGGGLGYKRILPSAAV